MSHEKETKLVRNEKKIQIKILVFNKSLYKQQMFIRDKCSLKCGLYDFFFLILLYLDCFRTAELLPVKAVLLWVGQTRWKCVQNPQRMVSSPPLFSLLTTTPSPGICGLSPFWKGLERSRMRVRHKIPAINNFPLDLR